MKLGLGYVPREHLGYGRMGVKMKAALEDLGVECVDPTDPAPAVCWMAFPSHANGKLDGQHLSCLTMWEGDRLPEGFRDTFDNFDTLFVPSDENVELFSEHHHDVRYVPLGIGPEWAPRPRPEVAGEFRFLISGSGARKGIDVAIAAFRQAFGGRDLDPLPRLIVKGKRTGASAANVDHISERLTPGDEINLYASAHCYVQPARGEGWGLRPLQAIAQGCPTILTDAHGHRAFAHLGIPIPARKAPAGPFIFGDAGNWWEPDVDAVSEAMLMVYGDYANHVERAADNAMTCHDTFTWTNSALSLLAGLPDLGTDYAGSGEHVPLTYAMYPLQVDRHRKADIGGKLYVFNPGETYQVPADVLRVMQDAGYAL